MKFFVPTALTAGALSLAQFVHSGNMPGVAVSGVLLSSLVAIEVIAFVKEHRARLEYDADLEYALREPLDRESDRNYASIAMVPVPEVQKTTRPRSLRVH